MSQIYSPSTAKSLNRTQASETEGLESQEEHLTRHRSNSEGSKELTKGKTTRRCRSTNYTNNDEDTTNTDCTGSRPLLSSSSLPTLSTLAGASQCHTPSLPKQEVEREQESEGVKSEREGMASEISKLVRSAGAEAQVMKRSQWKIKTNLESKRADYGKICSICCLPGSPTNSAANLIHSSSSAGLESGSLGCNRMSSVVSSQLASNKSGTLHVTGKIASSEPSKKCRDPLMSVCLCSGIRSWQHKSCIEDWLEQSGATSCPFCQVRYDIRRERKSFWSYMRESELEHDLLVSGGSLCLGSYLFIVGLAVCRHFIVNNLKADDHDGYHLSWPSGILFCFVLSSTVLLFIGIVSMGLSLVFRHYVKYSLWSKSHYRVRIRPYSLAFSNGGRE